VQESAVTAAVDQARLRKGVNRVFLNISMRNQSLLHRQLSMLDSMERRTSEPGALADLFRLDHLTTRMRRHAEGLIILSGSTPARGWRNPVPLVDVLRAAVAEVEDYVRVDVVSESHDLIAGNAVNDVTHLFAELIENATVFSPPNTRIEVRADRVGTGLAVEIEDRGLGLSEEELADINSRLARPAEFDLANSEQLGLFVVSRLATRHAITVTLRRSAYGGISAILLLPFGVIVLAEDAYSPAAPEAPGSSGSGDYRSDSCPNGAGEPSPDQPSGRQHHRLPAAATGRRADTGLTGVAGAAETTGSIGATGEQPRLAAVRDLPSQAWSPWRDAFRPGPVGRDQPVHHERADSGPDESLMPPGFSQPGSEETRAASSGSHLGMPIRIPQASLAPQLRAPHDIDSRSVALEAPRASERSPEATRDMLILMQEGWQRGRLDDLDELQRGPDNETG